jgi:hypothetical protein
LNPGTAPSEAQVVGCQLVCSVQVRDCVQREQADQAVTTAGVGHAPVLQLLAHHLVPPFSVPYITVQESHPLAAAVV